MPTWTKPMKRYVPANTVWAANELAAGPTDLMLQSLRLVMVASKRPTNTIGMNVKKLLHLPTVLSQNKKNENLLKYFTLLFANRPPWLYMIFDLIYEKILFALWQLFFFCLFWERWGT